MPAFGPIDIDESLWPLQIISYPAVSVSLEDYTRMLDWRSQSLKRQERQITVHDMSRLTLRSPTDHRRLHTAWMKQEERQLREWLAAVAYVTPSTTLRLLLSVVHHLNPLGMPYLLGNRMPDVAPWIELQLRQLGTGPDVRIVRERLGLKEGKT